MGATRLYLESNTKAAAAIHLYEELGFRHLPGAEHASKYARAGRDAESEIVETVVG